jgi:hypothetical protein
MRIYIFSLVNFIKNNEEHFQVNADVHSADTRHKHFLHKLTANLPCPQKNTYYAGIKIFYKLSSDLDSWTKKH